MTGPFLDYLSHKTFKYVFFDKFITKIVQNLCLVIYIYIFTKLLPNMCLINIHHMMSDMPDITAGFGTLLNFVTFF